MSDFNLHGSPMDYFHVQVTFLPFSWKPVTYALIFPWLDGSTTNVKPPDSRDDAVLSVLLLSAASFLPGTQRMEDLHFSRK